MSILINWVINGIAVFISGYLLSGVQIDSFVTALIVALVLGIVNAIIKPVLVVLTFPITLITFGLFTLVINALMIILTDALVKGFQVDNFWWALLFSIVVSIVNSVLYRFTDK
jgi:putative membrane protein